MMPNLLSPVAGEMVDIMSLVTIGDKIGTVTTLAFHCMPLTNHCMNQ